MVKLVGVQWCSSLKKLQCSNDSKICEHFSRIPISATNVDYVANVMTGIRTFVIPLILAWKIREITKECILRYPDIFTMCTQEHSLLNSK